MDSNGYVIVLMACVQVCKPNDKKGSMKRTWRTTDYRNIDDSTPLALRIPKGFRNKAQGCEGRATLGVLTESYQP
jgi:hypothetical protein